MAVGQPSRDVRRANFGKFMERALASAKERGLTIDKVRQLTGVGTTTIYRWRNGSWTRDPAPTEVRAFCRGLDIPVKAAFDALGWSDDRPSTAPEPDLDPDLKIVQRRLLDPTTPPEEIRIIKATLQHLARLADQQPPRKGAPRKKTA